MRIRQLVSACIAVAAALTVSACAGDTNVNTNQITNVDYSGGGTPQGVTVTGLDLSPKGPITGNTCVGSNTFQLSAMVILSNGQKVPTSMVGYASGNNVIAGIDQNGLGTRKSAGTVWIKGVYNPNMTLMDSVQVVVTDCPTGNPPSTARVMSITVIPNLLNLKYGQKDSAVVVVVVEGGASQEFTLEGLDPTCASVVRVNQKLFVTAQNRACSMDVKVVSTFDPTKFDVLRIRITATTPNDFTLSTSSTGKLACQATRTITASDGQLLTWSNSQPGIVSMSTTGPSNSVTVTGLSNGKAVVSGTNGTYSKSVEVDVECAPAAIGVTLSPATFTGTVGQPLNFSATVTGTTAPLTWTLSDPTCGTISANPMVSSGSGYTQSAVVSPAKSCSNLTVRAALSSGQSATSTGSFGSGNVVCSWTTNTGMSGTGPSDSVTIARNQTVTATGSCTNQFGAAFKPFWKTSDVSVVEVLGATSTETINGTVFFAGPQATLKGVFTGRAVVTMQAAIRDDTALSARIVRVP